MGLVSQSSLAISSGENLQVGPPGDFVAVAVQLDVVFAAYRNGKFVADLAAQRSGLRKFQVMGIAGLALEHHTSLGADMRQMSFAATAYRLVQGNDGSGRRVQVGHLASFGFTFSRTDGLRHVWLLFSQGRI